MRGIKHLLMNLPIVKLLRHHREERCEAECERQAILERQHDVARRVHVLEWMTFPHTTKKPHHDDH
jgi:hypothetical protein